MAHALNRRAFMRRASLLGASLLVPKPLSASALVSGSGDGELTNRFFTVSVDPKRGTLRISRRKGASLLAGQLAWAHTGAGTRSISSGHYRTTVDVAPFSDRIGPGKRLRITSRDLEHKLDFQVDLCLYDLLEAVTIEARCSNASGQDIAASKSNGTLPMLRAIATRAGRGKRP